MERVIVYGVGKYYREHEEDLHKRYEVVGLVDRSGEYNGGSISMSVSIEDIQEGCCVLIMTSRVKYIFEICTELLENGIDARKVIIGISIWGDYSRYTRISLTNAGKLELEKDNMCILVSSEDEFNNAADVFLMNCYKYHLATTNNEIVIDIGMNIGDATLYFLNQVKVKKVYGFEPFEKTFKDACVNLKNYIGSECLEVFPYGLSNCNAIRELSYNDQMSCGQSTISEINERATQKYESWNLINTDKCLKEQIEIRKSSEVLGEIVSRHLNDSIILKVDCEGEEFNIFSDLDNTGILENISLIMLEWHYRKPLELLSILNNNGFSYVVQNGETRGEQGIIVAWN